MTIEDKITAKLHDCGNVNKVAKYYDVPKEYVKEIWEVIKTDEVEYRKVLNKIRQTLPRHKDELADQKWEQALGQGAFN